MGRNRGWMGVKKNTILLLECFEFLFFKLLGLGALLSRISSNCLPLIRIHPKVS